MSQLRRWCFTVNNWVDEEYEMLLCLNHTFLIIAKEVGEEKHTPHLQGYIRFSQPVRLGALHRAVPRAHWSACNGSHADNVMYCKKGEQTKEEYLRLKSLGPNYGRNASYRVWGDEPSPGSRSDITEIKALVKAGGSMRDVFDVATSYQSMKMAEVGLGLFGRKRNWAPTVLWFWGPPDTGKSELASKLFPNAWWSSESLRWFNGYDGHEEVIIDDFRGDFCTLHFLLRLLDRYPLDVEVKGGKRPFLARTIVVTCPYPPNRVYKTAENIDQLLRRISLVRQFSVDGVPKASRWARAAGTGVYSEIGLDDPYASFAPSSRPPTSGTGTEVWGSTGVAAVPATTLPQTPSSDELYELVSELLLHDETVSPRL